MKKSLLPIAAAIALSGLALAAYAQNLAIVNGKPVPKARMDSVLQQITASGRQVPPEMLPQLRENMIMREVLMQEAQRRGLDASDEYRNELELTRQTLLIRQLMADFQKKSPVTDAEVKAEYDRFVKESGGGKEYHARHILVANEAEAKAIITQLKGGGKFEDIAKKQSKDSGSAASGGDLDWAAADSYVPEFSAAMVKLNKGQTTDVPVKTEHGWHVIRVDDVREAKFPSLDEVKPQVQQQLSQQKLAKFQEELRAKAKVE